MKNEDYTDSWKNKNIFQKQLELNKKEFINYPQHWIDFIEIVKSIKFNNKILDIGCGCGSFYKLCNDNFKDIEYTGIDYSIDAIELAKKEWNVDCFICKDIFDIDNQFISKYDTIYLGALLDVLNNGDDALKFILGFKIPYVILGRIEFTFNPNNIETYVAYDEIVTYKYRHNVNTFNSILDDMNYKIKIIKNNTILLEHIL